MPQVIGHVPEEKTHSCMVLDSPLSADCKAPVAWVVENLERPGFMKCCQRHFDNWKREYHAPTTKDWPVKEWEEAGKEAELKALIAAQKEG